MNRRGRPSLPNGKVFSCELEKYLWLVNHEATDETVMAWWIGHDFAAKGRCFDRVVWELRYGRSTDSVGS